MVGSHLHQLLPPRLSFWCSTFAYWIRQAVHPSLHFIMFLREQGYTVRKNILYQDNESAIKMKANGKMSCTSNSKHVDIRYFFVKDRVDKRKIEIRHYPTTKMVADYFTKPLQGALFHKLRRIIMGWRTKMIHGWTL